MFHLCSFGSGAVTEIPIVGVDPAIGIIAAHAVKNERLAKCGHLVVTGLGYRLGIDTNFELILSPGTGPALGVIDTKAHRIETGAIIDMGDLSTVGLFTIAECPDIERIGAVGQGRGRAVKDNGFARRNHLICA